MRVSIVGPNPPAAITKRDDRPSIFPILGVPDGGASKRGSTFWKSLFACPREHALTYEAGIELAYKGDPLTLGWAWHFVLQLYHEALAAGVDKNDAALKAYAPITTLEQHQDYADFGSKLRAMFEQYLNTYEGRDNWKILAVEETLEYEGAFEYTARLDLVVHDLERNVLLIVEHKSARNLSAELLDNYQLDLQILGQVWLVEHCVDLSKYPPFHGVLVNVTTTGTKLPQCARTEVLPSVEHLAAFERSVRGLVTLRKQLQKLQWPQYLGNCSGYSRGYSRCKFFDLCHDYPAMMVDDWKTADVPPTYVRQELP